MTKNLWKLLISNTSSGGCDKNRELFLVLTGMFFGGLTSVFLIVIYFPVERFRFLKNNLTKKSGTILIFPGFLKSKKSTWSHSKVFLKIKLCLFSHLFCYLFLTFQELCTIIKQYQLIVYNYIASILHRKLIKTCNILKYLRFLLSYRRVNFKLKEQQ